MGRTKGEKNKSWTASENYKVIKPVIDGKISSEDQAKKIGMKSSGMICIWIKKYNSEGMKGLENKRKPGNPLSKYSNKKELTETEKLEYEILKLRIENERLKKGYTSKEVDLAKQKKSNKKNSR